MGVPETRALEPAPRLYSRLVIIKGFMITDGFLDAAQRQLDALAVKGRPELVSTNSAPEANASRVGGTTSPMIRRTLRIRDKNVVGFALRVTGLTAEESIRLQEAGLGGRRRFGCGIFIQDRTGE